MVRALSARVTREYVLLEERELPDAERSTFTLRTITGLDRLRMRAYAMGRGESPQEVVELSIAWLAENGIVGWRNVPESDEKMLPFSRANIARLPPEALFEIGNEILDSLNLSADDAGKSEGQSNSRSDDPPPAPSAED